MLPKITTEIISHNSEKSYHPYLSHDFKHDQAFVECVLREMINTVETKPGTTAKIESDNCSQQYKSCAHFENI